MKIIGVLISGTIIYKYWDEIKKIWRNVVEILPDSLKHNLPCYKKTPLAPPKKILLAAWISVSKGKTALKENNPYQIFSDAGARWFGRAEEWSLENSPKQSLKLEEIFSLPENNDETIVISYELEIPEQETIPNNRMAMRNALKAAQERGELSRPSIWHFSQGFIDPTLNGFK